MTTPSQNRAVFLEAIGGPENFAIKNYDPGAPKPGTLRVRNHAIGMNFIDTYRRSGLYPIETPALLGEEAAGIVEAIGEGVDGFCVGDRVAYLNLGAYSDISCPPADMVVKLPDAISDEAAAASFLKGLTVDMLINRISPLKAGQTCLVYAATGGVGGILTQWAASIGANVIAVVGAAEKTPLAKSYGANHVIVRTEIESISDEVRKQTGGRGVEIVYDSIGAATFFDSLDSLAPRGMMVTYGNASGPAPAFAPLELAKRGSLILTRPTLFDYFVGEQRAEMAAALFKQIESGNVSIRIDRTFGLNEIADAHRYLESGVNQGAIVIKP